jgi:hypothetical protein
MGGHKITGSNTELVRMLEKLVDCKYISDNNMRDLLSFNKDYEINAIMLEKNIYNSKVTVVYSNDMYCSCYSEIPIDTMYYALTGIYYIRNIEFTNKLSRLVDLKYISEGDYRNLTKELYTAEWHRIVKLRITHFGTTVIDAYYNVSPDKGWHLATTCTSDTSLEDIIKELE